MAIENDYLHFFAPGDDVFDSIINNAMRSDKGQCAALLIQTDMEWKGFVFTLSLEPNMELLLKHQIPVTAISRFKNYMAVDQLVVPVSFSEYSEVSISSVVRQLERISESGVSCLKDNVAHLGKRTPQSDMLHIKEKYKISNLEWFMGKYPEELWGDYVRKAHKKAVDYGKNRFTFPGVILSLKFRIGTEYLLDCRFYFTCHLFSPSIQKPLIPSQSVTFSVPQ